MLTNTDIEDMCANQGIQLYEVVMKDELCNLPFKNGNYIVNMQSSNCGNGSH